MWLIWILWPKPLFDNPAFPRIFFTPLWWQRPGELIVTSCSGGLGHARWSEESCVLNHFSLSILGLLLNWPSCATPQNETFYDWLKIVSIKILETDEPKMSCCNILKSPGNWICARVDLDHIRLTMFLRHSASLSILRVYSYSAITSAVYYNSIYC